MHASRLESFDAIGLSIDFPGDGLGLRASAGTHKTLATHVNIVHAHAHYSHRARTGVVREVQVLRINISSVRCVVMSVTVSHGPLQGDPSPADREQHSNKGCPSLHENKSTG